MKRIEAKKARRRIATLWYIAGGIIVLIFVIQSLNGKFEDKISDAWMWISQNLFAFVTLVSGSLILDFQSSATRYVNKSYYQFSMYFSLFYLGLLVVIILFYPFSDYAIIDYYRSTSIYLIPIQGIVSGILGMFFIKGNDVSENV